MTINDVADNIIKYKPVAIYFTSNESLANDVLQDAFIKIDRRFKKVGSLDFITYKGQINESYMFMVIKSCYYDIIRKETRYTDGKLIDKPQYQKEPFLINQHMKGLSWYEKKLTQIYFEEEHSIRSLAKATNISTTNIFTTLKKTKNAIQMSINKEVEDEIKKTITRARREKGVKPKLKYHKGKPAPDSPYVAKKQAEAKAKKRAKAIGLGDTVEAITKATGIKKLVDKIFDKLGKDCGCDERKEKLNKMFRYPNITCMNKEQFVLWRETSKRLTGNLSNQDLKIIAKLHSDIFGHKYYEPCRCTPKEWARWVKEIGRVFETYKDDAEQNLKP